MLQEYMRKYKEYEKQINNEFLLEQNEIKLNFEMKKVKDEKKIVDFLPPLDKITYDSNTSRIAEINKAIAALLEATKNKSLNEIIDKVNDKTYKDFLEQCKVDSLLAQSSTEIENAELQNMKNIYQLHNVSLMEFEKKKEQEMNNLRTRLIALKKQYDKRKAELDIEEQNATSQGKIDEIRQKQDMILQKCREQIKKDANEVREKLNNELAQSFNNLIEKLKNSRVKKSEEIRDIQIQCVQNQMNCIRKATSERIRRAIPEIRESVPNVSLPVAMIKVATQYHYDEISQNSLAQSKGSLGLVKRDKEIVFDSKASLLKSYKLQSDLENQMLRFLETQELLSPEDIDSEKSLSNMRNAEKLREIEFKCAKLDNELANNRIVGFERVMQALSNVTEELQSKEKQYLISEFVGANNVLKGLLLQDENWFREHLEAFRKMLSRMYNDKIDSIEERRNNLEKMIEEGMKIKKDLESQADSLKAEQEKEDAARIEKRRILEKKIQQKREEEALTSQDQANKEKLIQQWSNELKNLDDALEKEKERQLAKRDLQMKQKAEQRKAMTKQNQELVEKLKNDEEENLNFKLKNIDSEIVTPQIAIESKRVEELAEKYNSSKDIFDKVRPLMGVISNKKLNSSPIRELYEGSIGRRWDLELSSDMLYKKLIILGEKINLFTGPQFTNIRTGYISLIDKINSLKQFLEGIQAKIEQQQKKNQQ